MLEKFHFSDVVCRELGIDAPAPDLAEWESGEFDELCRHKVIDFMPGQSEDIDKGGTLRLGEYPCVIAPGTTMERCYGTGRISERPPLFKGFIAAALDRAERKR